MNKVVEDLENTIKWWKLVPKYPKPIHKEVMLKSLLGLKRKLKRQEAVWKK